MLSPLDPVKPAHAEAISLTTSFAPWFIDIVLLLRLHAIYPRSLTPRSKLLAIFSLPIVIKLARFTALVAFAVIWRRRNSAGPQNASSSLAPFPRPAITFEWSAQIVDNGWV